MHRRDDEFDEAASDAERARRLPPPHSRDCTPPAPKRPELARLEWIAQGTADVIGPQFDRAQVGFAILAFEHGAGDWSGFVTNVDAFELVRALRAIADGIERKGAS